MLRIPSALLVVLAALVAFAARRADAARQLAWRADVHVRAIDVVRVRQDGPTTTRVVVASDDDAARGVRLEVMLPVGVGVLHMADGCRTSPAPVSTLAARVTCALGDLPAHAPRSVFVTTSGRPASAQPRIAVFALSDTPDPIPSNNYAERSVP